MDECLTTIYLRLRNLHGCSVDDVLEDPKLRLEFLHSAWQDFPRASERDVLHRLIYLRKKSRLLPAKSH
jgi:hypothetical protein